MTADVKFRISTQLWLSVLVLCFAFAATVSAQIPNQLPTVPPQEVGLSAERLQRIDTKIQGYIDREEAAGAMALICRRGKVGYVQTWGDRNREAGDPMTEDTIFRIYSMSKPITSVAVMMLYEEGRFFLTDPVSKFLPEFADMQVQTETRDPETGEISVETKSATRQITIRDLLRHTAGLTYGIFGDTKVDQAYREAGILSQDMDLAETSQKLGKIPLRFEPGTKWHYSVSVDVAGRLVEVVSGMSFDAFLKERIFLPLGMVDTGFVVPPEKRNRFSVLYTPKGTVPGRDAFLRGGPNTKLIEPLKTKELSDYNGHTKFLSGGGGLASTTRDYLRFCQMMLNGGKLDDVRILSRKSVELMTSDNMVKVNDGQRNDGTSFGLGFGILTNVGTEGALGSEGTYSWGGAAGTKFWIDPQEELIGIFMVQILPHRTRMGDEFRLLTYQAIDD